MAQISGLVGLRPNAQSVSELVSPPYDVIKEGGSLEALLKANPKSYFHIILGETPKATLDSFVQTHLLEEDNEPAFYIFEQTYAGGIRTGFYSAVAVDDYSQGNVVRHEKTFDSKVQGRIRLARETGHTLGPIFLLTASPIGPLLSEVKASETPVYDFTSNFDPTTDLHGVHNRVWRVPESSVIGQKLVLAVAQNPLYIADGHHRYHAALRNEQTHTLAYIVEDATIQAYNRVINGKQKFAHIKNKLSLSPISEFSTPPKHVFHIYSKEGSFALKASSVPEDVVGRLDCSLLEKDLYTHLEITHDMILDQKHFDYYPETALAEMKAKVDSGAFDIAVALHPVSIQELMDVANAGLKNSDIVMPEKSTFFSPKILSGIFAYRHQLKSGG